MINGQRAYVAPVGINFESGVRLDIKNSGATPADSVKNFSNWEPRPVGQCAEFCKTFSFPERNQCQVM
ncbi:MAG: hypothetical protein JWO45_1096 [Spartobacteria bacterium]|nr:hypothetical protein [Spartobacteria bacterium]